MQENNVLIINGQEIKPFNEEDCKVEWFNYNAYTEAVLTLNNKKFNIMVLKDDIERFKKLMKEVNNDR